MKIAPHRRRAQQPIERGGSVSRRDSPVAPAQLRRLGRRRQSSPTTSATAAAAAVTGAILPASSAAEVTVVVFVRILLVVVTERVPPPSRLALTSPDDALQLGHQPAAPRFAPLPLVGGGGGDVPCYWPPDSPSPDADAARAACLDRAAPRLRLRSLPYTEIFLSPSRLRRRRDRLRGGGRRRLCRSWCRGLLGDKGQERMGYVRDVKVAFEKAGRGTGRTSRMKRGHGVWHEKSNPNPAKEAHRLLPGVVIENSPPVG